ncbi:MAG: hypothetical protein MZW92_73415 [Comamonadaceae bacterium]|nr:hypothetical protein [Comamonadaceae bacterium]
MFVEQGLTRAAQPAGLRLLRLLLQPRAAAGLRRRLRPGTAQPHEELGYQVKLLLAALCAAASAGATAQTVSARVSASQDSDDFDQTVFQAGTAAANGFGVRATRSRYRAPGWSADGQALAATFSRRDATTTVDVAAGVARVEGRTLAVGEVDAMRTLAPGSAVGVSAERGIVDSVRAIDDGVAYTSVALVADHAFNARLNVGVAAGQTFFGDDNRRPFVRTRWNLELAPQWGLNAYLRTRNLRHHEASTAYYSPSRLNEAALGLSARVAVGGAVVVSAAADRGRQHADGQREPVWSASLGVGAPRAARVQWQLRWQAANTASQFGGSADYRYDSLNASLSVPF